MLFWGGDPTAQSSCFWQKRSKRTDLQQPQKIQRRSMHTRKIIVLHYYFLFFVSLASVFFSTQIIAPQSGGEMLIFFSGYDLFIPKIFSSVFFPFFLQSSCFPLLIFYSTYSPYITHINFFEWPSHMPNAHIYMFLGWLFLFLIRTSEKKRPAAQKIWILMKICNSEPLWY